MTLNFILASQSWLSVATDANNELNLRVKGRIPILWTRTTSETRDTTASGQLQSVPKLRPLGRYWHRFLMGNRCPNSCEYGEAIPRLRGSHFREMKKLVEAVVALVHTMCLWLSPLHERLRRNNQTRALAFRYENILVFFYRDVSR